MQKYTRPVSYLVLCIILLIPVFMIKDNISFSTTTDLLFFIHRILGLYAFSLMFLQILTGSSRPLLQKVFDGPYIVRFHMGVGKVAFLFAILHPLLLLSTYLSEKSFVYVTSYMSSPSLIYFMAGLIALILLFISVGAAVYRMKIGPKWIQIHRINYLIFWLVFFHSLGIGEDVKTNFSQSIYFVYGITAFILTAGKWFFIIKQRISKTGTAHSQINE